MACTEEMIGYALQIAPASVCLVPEKREEITTEGGLDLIKHFDRVKEVVCAMESAGIAANLFIDPEENQIRAAAGLAAPWIELHTGAGLINLLLVNT